MAANAVVAGLAAEGGDPRMSQTVIRDRVNPNRSIGKLLHDPSIR